MSNDDASWSRALMASAGVAVHGQGERTHRSAQWHEAAAIDTPRPRLLVLGMSRDPEVRCLVGARPDCPMGMLSTLAHDRHTEVRQAVAGNARLVDAVAQVLSKDRSPEVLKALARNEGIDIALIQRLALHKREDVRRVAAKTLNARTAPGAEAATADEWQATPELRDKVEPRVGQPDAPGVPLGASDVARAARLAALPRATGRPVF